MRRDNDSPHDSLVDLDELASMLRVHEGPPRPDPKGIERPATPRNGFRALRWAAVAAAALLVGSGLGFGLGSSITPSGSAVSKFTGLGFLPARGWTVVQTGTVGPTGKAVAIAANVPLDANDDLENARDATLASLPRSGIVIHATFTTRGDPTEDVRFVARTLPLQLANARVVSPSSDPVASGRELAQYRLRAGVGGYNVEALVYYGAVPSAAAIAAAQRQLNRLVVASERVTITARPTSLRWAQSATLFGSIDNGRADEEVILQAKDCGQKFFTGVASILTHEGGTWTTEFGRGINTTLRAIWKGAASPTVTLRQQPRLELMKRSARRFEVGVGSRGQFWHRRVLFQRRQSGKWGTVKSVLLTDTIAHPGSGSTWTEAEFTATVPKGSLVRAFLPTSQARPCYLPAASDTLRT